MSLELEAITANNLTTEIQRKAPGYVVKWNPSIRAWEDEPYGMYEVWADGYCHYRRRTANGIRKLAGIAVNP